MYILMIRVRKIVCQYILVSLLITIQVIFMMQRDKTDCQRRIPLKRQIFSLSVKFKSTPRLLKHDIKILKV